MDNLAVMREIAPSAQIAAGAVIGPFCVVGPNAVVGPRTRLGSRTTVSGCTTIGSDNDIAEGCVLGGPPQDLKYAGGPTRLIVGHRNRLGRFVTVHTGTEFGGYLTRIGSDNVLHDGCHVAHDCYVDDRTVLGADVLLAGHIHICSGAVVEQRCGVHHYVTVGSHARVRRCTPVRRDVPPFAVFAADNYDWQGSPAVVGAHDEGIRAAKLGHWEESELREALRDLFEDEAALQTKIEQLVNIGVEGAAAELCRFCLRSLQGLYGRCRESYRGTAPPEALQYLPPELQAVIRRTQS
ncbi:MAG: hypothetical protein ABFD92_14810 [Planctomycetaceae bacterium]|nr:hypothetical protein [Planctomycetaceae bacterium]